MKFVFGGAWQGMEEYAAHTYGVGNPVRVNEQDTDIDFSSGSVTGLERFVLGCVRRGESAQKYFEEHSRQWQDCVLIGIDFSCGLVPMDAEERLWREENGRLNNYLAANAERVVRMFCGIEQVLK